MANGMCDICGIRPATVRAQVARNDHQETLELCDFDYRRLARQQGRMHSPLESLFGGQESLFEDFFGNDFFGESPFASARARATEAPDAEGGGASIPVRPGRGRARGAAGAAERLSEHAEEILQSAARRAADFGRREVDTEHLLLALTESDVVRTILEQFKVSLDDLRNQIVQESPHGEAEPQEGGEIGVSPRMKDALSRAFRASAELGHSYVGPEHLLIGLAEEGEGLAADMLRRYGLTPRPSASRSPRWLAAVPRKDGSRRPPIRPTSTSTRAT